MNRNALIYTTILEAKIYELWIETGRRAIKYKERNRGRIYKDMIVEYTRKIEVRKG